MLDFTKKVIAQNIVHKKCLLFIQDLIEFLLK
jgi:hypothetical protein